ncbi:pentatricopeptide repeat-containing protein At3g29230-like [Malania oleifera]|uniref:pentatricopeptide repeat-containing protein At3g29230-like n=1 Tax=Malania oleifera TaxID=397392 RepID=UPI0025AE666A|nr:pentatricopeptide repeat-containing protein At3g29230-like [Malania oleifera]XP_057953227.1 pentatricopeptide repeat-containing protein At3g29230-like [Malania oleifera]XP_057953228.1 pentatricopeptide repeat-containing protein At3g29230-like [Malania oleifera]
MDLSRCLLKRSLHLNQLNQIHAQILVSGLHQDDHLVTKLITYTISTGNSKLASLVFRQVKCPTRLLWTSMIRGYSFNGPHGEAVIFYSLMKGQSFLPNNYNFPFALKACGILKTLFEGQQIHSDIVKLGFLSDIFVQTALLDMYVKCSRMECAKRVFDNMAMKNVVSWTAILAGYCNNGFLEQAEGLFHDMPAKNVVSWNVMINGLARLGHLEEARQYFDRMPQKTVVSWTTMICGYSRAGDLTNARLFFDCMGQKEVVAWTAMISSYVQNGAPDEAIKLFSEMLASGVKVDEVTMLAVISAATELSSLHLCAWIENRINEGGLNADIRILNAILNMYVQCGRIDKALEIFHKMPMRDVISYNSVIMGCASHGNADSALSLFSMMIEAKVQPNSITFVGVLTACAHMGLVDEGRKYFHLMLELGFIEPKVEHYACMVDLLGRAGYIDEAYDVVVSMPIRPEASTWGALLGACRIHGRIDLAELVSKKLFEMEPDNPGNYAILANIYSEKRMWDEAGRVRKAMEDKRVLKTPGSSWAELAD